MGRGGGGVGTDSQKVLKLACDRKKYSVKCKNWKFYFWSWFFIYVNSKSMSARTCLYVRKVIFCVFIMKMYLFHIYLCFSFHSKATSAGTRWWHRRDSCTPGTTSQPTSSLPPSLRKWWGPTCVKSYWVPKSKIWCVWFLISNVEWSSTHKNITFWKITFHTSIFHELQLLYYFLFIDLQF